MELPKPDLEVLWTVPTGQKVTLLGLILAGLITGFYYLDWESKRARIQELKQAVANLDKTIDELLLKVKHLDELIAANKQLELELEKKKEKLPPEGEAVMLLKQLSDMGARLGLEIRLWKPGPQAEDPSKLFVRMPVSVEVAGGYHTAALFFDRINKMQRIVNVSDLKMGGAKMEGDHVVIQTVFELTAFAAPPEPKPGAPPAK
ncbi:type 4a pilus biogenesis protein PilO [Nitrospira sp. Kam-Ns4a]